MSTEEKKVKLDSISEDEKEEKDEIKSKPKSMQEIWDDLDARVPFFSEASKRSAANIIQAYDAVQEVQKYYLQIKKKVSAGSVPVDKIMQDLTNSSQFLLALSEFHNKLVRFIYENCTPLLD